MSDVKYICSSFNILNIYDIQCISVLLKNNVKIYGSFLSDIIFNRNSIYRYFDNGGIVQGWCLKIYKDIIERDLFPQLVDKTIINKKVYSSSVLYTLDIGGVHVKIKILYVDDYFEHMSLDTVIEECEIYLDSGLLQLDRGGLGLLYIPDIYKSCPNPFYKICRQNECKKFTIIEGSSALKNIELKELYKLISNGWTYKSDIKKISIENRDIKCSFCGNNINNEGYELPCKHIYHRDCWRDSCDMNSKLDEKIECLKCDYSDYVWKLLC